MEKKFDYNIGIENLSKIKVNIENYVANKIGFTVYSKSSSLLSSGLINHVLLTIDHSG